MSRVVAIGERELVDGYGLAGVEVLRRRRTRPRCDGVRGRGADAAGHPTPAAEARSRERLAEPQPFVWVVLPA